MDILLPSQTQTNKQGLNQQNHLRKRICFTLIMMIIAAYTAAAMLYGPADAVAEIYTPRENDIIGTLTPAQITLTENCAVDTNGKIVFDGLIAKYGFSEINQRFQTIVLQFDEPASNSFFLIVDLIMDSGDQARAYLYCPKGSYDACTHVPLNHYQSMTITDRNVESHLLKMSNYQLKSIALHSDTAERQLIPYEDPFENYYLPIVIFVGLFTAGIVFLSDKKFKLSLHFFSFIEKHYRTGLKTLIGIAASYAAAAVIEWIISRFTGMRSDGSVFNTQRWFLIAGIVMMVLLFYVCRKTIAKRPEKVFLGAILILGVTMILVQPFGHTCWDIDSHYEMAFSASYLRINPLTWADDYILHPSGMHVMADTVNAMSNNTRMMIFNQASHQIIGPYKDSFTIAHLPAGLFLAWARFGGIPFVGCLLITQFSNLLIYALVCYAAMKRLKSGKIILAAIAMIPTSVFIAANITYDYWVTCFTIYGVAYFISELQQPDKPITVKDAVFMCGAIGLGSLPKLIYAPLMILPFFMRKKDFTNRKRYYLSCIVMMILFFVLLLIKSFDISVGSGDVRGGSDVNATLQLQYIIQNPLTAVCTLVNFLKYYLSVYNVQNYIALFAHLECGRGYLIYLSLMLISAFTDKNEYDALAYQPLLRPLCILLYVGLAAACALALYISYTPVGLDTVNGCQARYLIPLLYPLLATIGPNKIKNPINQPIYNMLMMGSCCAYNFYLIATVMLPFWN